MRRDYNNMQHATATATATITTAATCCQQH